MPSTRLTHRPADVLPAFGLEEADLPPGAPIQTVKVSGAAVTVLKEQLTI